MKPSIDALEEFISRLQPPPAWEWSCKGDQIPRDSRNLPLKDCSRVKAIVSGVHSRRVAINGIFLLDRCYSSENAGLANI